MAYIEWQGNGYSGLAKTASGRNACITEAFQTTGVGKYYSLYIEGEKKNSCTRAKLEKVMAILEAN